MPQKITFLPDSVTKVVDHFSLHNSSETIAAIASIPTRSTPVRGPTATHFSEGSERIAPEQIEPSSISVAKKHIALLQKQPAPSDWKLDLATATLKSVNPNAAFLLEGYQNLIKAGVPREELHSVVGEALLMGVGGGAPGFMLGTTLKAGLAVIPKSISTPSQIKLADAAVERLMATLEKRLARIINDPNKTPDQITHVLVNRVEKYDKLKVSNARQAKQIEMDPSSPISKQSINADYFQSARKLAHDVLDFFAERHGITVLNKRD